MNELFIGFLLRGAGSEAKSRVEHQEDSQMRILLEAESRKSKRIHSAWAEDKESSPTPPEVPVRNTSAGPMSREEDPGEVMSLDEFSCRVVEKRLICYSILRKRCVLLRDGRHAIPKTIVGRAMADVPLPLCSGFKNFVEV